MLRRSITLIIVLCFLAVVGGCATKRNDALVNARGLSSTTSPGQLTKATQRQLVLNHEIDNQLKNIDGSLQSLDNTLTTADQALKN